MYLITANGFTVTCENKDSVIGWIDFFIKQGHIPTIEKEIRQ